jgi:hypothetical protein
VGLLDFESGEYEVLRRLKLLGVADLGVGDRLLRSSMPAADLEQWRAYQVVIDSFAAATSGDENDKSAARLLMHAGTYAERYGAGVLVIHHERKGSGGDVRESVRGSTAIYAACDRIYGFSPPETMPGGAVRTTMTPEIKHGAGTRAPSVTVELTDAGLTYVDAPKVEAVAPEARIRAEILASLADRSAGINKPTLIASITGKTKTVQTVLASLVLAETVVEFGRGHERFVMLKPT